mmetsp:Transcript_10583/g.39423  ORF Transcript_10583/g.39423 Transcript_10583/m.39423 type:complete len:749 (-) Transcript_10583:118-2364(-)|eukprot:CAMPEP_0117440950 /NCGR_PEP_ID=MMETSP0759-20121206/3365_1 /TAXON_ID=63605 /ORGANISM="Percolomonas cosmopolitus, Strain WS" /LENGTH=748 /DNA_ID=CAMNT_0005232753 /DNA_START=154 /DNA_END=2400 /DNA_ORIENTATION=+
MPANSTRTNSSQDLTDSAATYSQDDENDGSSSYISTDEDSSYVSTDEDIEEPFKGGERKMSGLDGNNSNKGKPPAAGKGTKKNAPSLTAPSSTKNVAISNKNASKAAYSSDSSDSETYSTTDDDQYDSDNPARENASSQQHPAFNTESLDMSSPFMKNLKKMFDKIDSSGDGYIQATELAQIMRAFGKTNLTEKELKQMIATVDLDNDSQLDFYEFVYMVRDAMPELFDRAQNPRAWRKYVLNQMKGAFKVFDKDGDGVISREEMRYALAKISTNKEISDTEFNSIIHLLDANNDGEIDFDEFTKALNDRKGDLYQRLETVLMPSPLDFLQSFMNMPDSFRPSLLHQKMKEGTQLSSRYMKPYLNESGLAYQDLILDLSETKTPKLLPCYLENCGTFRVSLISANGIPSPNINSKQFQTNKHIVQYKALMCLVDLTSNQFLSNVYTVKAKRNKSREDGWKFSKKNPINDVYVRSFHDVTNLALYIEMVLEISTKKDNGFTITEQCVGWSTLPIAKDLYRNVQAQRLAPIPLQVKGGTLQEPTTINQSDIRNRRKDFAGILRNVLYVGKPNPTLNVKVSRVAKAKQIEFFSKCPPNLIFCKDSVPVLELYRIMLANRLINHPNLDDQHNQVNSILLSQLPKLMDDPSIWMTFVDSWNVQKTSSKNREKKFLQHIRDFYSVRYCLSLPTVNKAQKSNRNNSPAQSDAQQISDQRNNFINQFAVASKKMTCQSDYFYEPFDMQSETLFDIF